MTTNPFDEKAATWDEDPTKWQRAQVVADAIRSTVPLSASTRLLEYGAATGLVTQALRSDVGPVTVADSSQGMLTVLRSKVEAGVLEGATVWDLDLVRDPVPGDRFDLVVSVMTLHHIPDLTPVLDGFATMLDRGGHLCVIDLDREDGWFHEDESSFQGHDGFDHDDLAARLERAGFPTVRFTTLGQVERHGRAYDLFLAVATRL